MTYDKLEIDNVFEDEFAKACDMVQISNKEEMTSDGEWTHSELKDDVYDVCTEVLTQELVKKYKFKAIYDANLLKPQYMTEQILNQIGNPVELYNKENKDNDGDTPGIYLYDNAIKDMILNKLKENVVIS